MSHVRTQIRAALVALIESAEGLAGRVVSDPTEVKDADAGPWVEVAVGPELIQPRSMGNSFTGRHMTRQVPLFAEIHTRGAGDGIKAAEDLLALIEAKVFTDRQLGGLLLAPMTLVGVEPSPPDLGGSLGRHSLRVQWNSVYSTTESDATAAAGSN